MRNRLLSGFITKIKNPFFTVSLLLCISLCFFQLWLYWPGYIQDDSQTTLLLIKSGWHPVIMAYLVEIMHNLFGVHVYNLFLLTMVPFYLGIWIIIYSVYIKTKSWCSLLLIFPCLIGNIFYALIKMGSSSFSLSWGVLLYALTLYMILQPVPQKRSKTFYIFYGIVFIIALLGRQNAILQVWPVTFVWIGLYLAPKELSFGKYFGYFIPLSVLSGIISSILLIGGSFALKSSDTNDAYPATLIVMHQIVATCAPEMDESCFNPDWWIDGWSEDSGWSKDPNRMERLKIKYEKYKTNPEAFSLSNYSDVTFKYFTNLKGRYSKLLYAIKKYPHNYIQHLKRYYMDVWSLAPYIPSQEKLLNRYYRDGMIQHANIWNSFSEREKIKIENMANQMPENELMINWTESKSYIDCYIRDYFPSFYIFDFIGINFMLFFMGIYLFAGDRKNILYLYLASTSGSGVLSSIIIPLFCPKIYVRYMDPVVICAALAIVCVMLLLLLQRKNICKFYKKVFQYVYRKI